MKNAHGPFEKLSKHGKTERNGQNRTTVETKEKLREIPNVLDK